MLDEQPQTESHTVEPDVSAEKTAAPSGPAPTPSTSTHAAQAAPTAPLDSASTLNALPGYTRSLLKIKVPVVVTLAQTKQTLRKIVELAPGAIIQFDKSCDEMLQLAVGHRPLAEGQAVKVGDKFGICVSSILMPEERFKPVLSPASGIG